MKYINWYPGHMKKTRELIRDNLKIVDVVIEVIDSRIPYSSRNPIIDELVDRKERVIALNKCDLADSRMLEDWISYFKRKGDIAIPINAMSGKGVTQLFQCLKKIEDRNNAGLLRVKPLRIMIVGVPNVGKSSLINRMTGRKSAMTGNRPGVTKGKQWLSLKNGMMLLDTPGILWPKLGEREVGLNLAFCGSIKDEIMDIAELALELISLLSNEYPELLQKRYKLEELKESPLEIMESIAEKRGFLLSGRKIDYERTGKTVVEEFRNGDIGKITLEKCEYKENNEEKNK